MVAAFQNSPFLMALGWAIANSIWQCGLLWVLYYFFAGLNQKSSAKFKNLLSTALVFIAFCWFAYTLVEKLLSSKPLPDYPAALTGLVNEPSVIYWYNADELFSTLEFLLPYFSVAYIILLFLFFIKFFNAYKTSLFIRTYGILPAPDCWLAFTENAASKIRLNRKLSIWFSTYINVPATVGFLKPVILIPVASLNQLTTDQLEAIILHELAHIKRNDYLINILVSVIETILFFNPFIVLLVKILKKEREDCCDDLVIDYKYDRLSYASALVSIEKTRLSNYHLVMSATSGKNQLLNRVKRIVENGKEINNFNYGQKLLALLTITAIIISISWVYPHKQVYNSSQTVAERIDIKPAPVMQNISSEDSFQYKPKKKQVKVNGIHTEQKSNQATQIINETPEFPSAYEIHEEYEKENISNDEKKNFSPDVLNALISQQHLNNEDDTNKDDTEFTFDVDFSSIANNINNINWNHIFTPETFESFNSEKINNEIKALLDQATKNGLLKRTLIGKKTLSEDLPDQFRNQGIHLNNELNQKEIENNFLRLKLDTLINDRLINIPGSEELLVYSKVPRFEQAELRIVNSIDSKKRYKYQVPARTVKPRSAKQVKPGTPSMPVSINIKGNELVLNNEGIRLKKATKTSIKNIKKVILSFGDETVHLNLED